MSMDKLLLRKVSDKNVKLEAVFRRMDGVMPTDWGAGAHWQVEVYEYGLQQPPIAMGWVLWLIPPAEKKLPVEDWYPPDLECVRVFGEYQNKDVAFAVIQAARLKWPNLTVNRGSSEQGTEAMKQFRESTADRWKVIAEDNDETE
jgi:hypothetical protein